MARKPPKGKSLAEVNPQLAKEWHPTKNGDLTPLDFSQGSEKKVWWKCHKGNDHEWESNIANRSRGTNCPVCVGQKVVKSNCLATTNPSLAKEWHPTKNGKLTPSDVTSGTRRKAWWKCDKGDDHEWEASICPRNNGVGCAVCRGFVVVKSNRLATLNPELAKQWHPTKNGELTPEKVTISSGKKVWWKCDKGDDHEWFVTIAGRSAGSNCPICAGKKVVKSNCLATTNPSLAKEWHPTKNGNLTPSEITSGSNKRVWWKCDKGKDHEWITFINSRSSGHGCPACDGRQAAKSNCLATIRPDLIKEWHPTKNRDKNPYNVVAFSGKYAWWKCDNGDDHEWKATISSRSSQGVGCPVCVGQKVVKSNSLAETHPALAKQWHPTKNGNLSPEDCLNTSNKIVWWKCDKGSDHEWCASCDQRVRKESGCPMCSGHSVAMSNCLATLNPELAEQWHPTKNGNKKPSDFTVSSAEKVWWLCHNDNTHFWKSSIANRNKGRDCPSCSESGFDKLKEAYFYIRKITINDQKVALKFGITNQMDGGREKQQIRNLTGDMKTIFKIKTKGVYALKIESRCKVIYGTKGYLSKNEMKDGFTETIKYSEESLNRIKSIVDEVLTDKAEKKK